MRNYIPLDRQFLPVHKNEEEAESEEVLLVWGHGETKS
jgi:hypothetical protein